MRMTKQSIDKLPVPAPLPSGKSNQHIYRDDHLSGFAVRVTSTGVKSFIVEKRLGRKNRRITIGRYGHLTLEQGRLEAVKLLGKLATGVDPIHERKVERVKQITLKQMFDDYIEGHPTLTAYTIKDYERSINGSFKDWQNKPVTELSKDLIEKRHRDLGRVSHARANNAMRVLRAVYNYAMDKYDDLDGNPIIQSNPVSRLSRTRGWFRVERRRTVIKPHQLRAWYDATLQLQSDTARDYLHFTLLTGLRRGESARLTWKMVDFEDRTITIPETKNGESHTLPLSDFLYELLKRRYETCGGFGYVFPAESKEGHYTDPKRAIEYVIDWSGVQFCMHDLRRTFITVAESLDISIYTLKRLLNHKMTNDVTAGYIVLNTERLREPMQRITDYFLRTFYSSSNVAYIRKKC